MDGWNYFSYYSEIEEYFWKKRGAHLLVSPLDWAIMESWQKAGVPLSAVLKGIDRAFESYQKSRRGAGRPLKSLAYCTDAVLEAAEEEMEAAAGAAPDAKRRASAQEVLCREDLREYFRKNAAKMRESAKRTGSANPELARRVEETAGALEASSELLEAPGTLDLEDLERRLTVFEEKLQAALTTHADEELMVRLRRELDRQLAAYRSKLKAEQLRQVERQYLQKRLFEEFGLPRLSLYYFS
ncbi:MAG: hypothetical protein AUI53_02260 [Acidobacteria bacterium 13_1_40CM_2_60_7]|nr:MAG: hypothetical protein AUI53_02260 [Acidobacteria bacterium 13_1_40CM_2_60_7]